jgi:hypothetical protein
MLLTSQGSDAYPLKWWGCHGDGRTDDAPGLSNASQSLPSGALVFAPGPYVVQESSSIPVGIRTMTATGPTPPRKRPEVAGIHAMTASRPRVTCSSASYGPGRP